MYTQAQTRKPSKPMPVVFMRRSDPEPSAVFIPGECVCKVCKSSNLRFIAYLDDAKCDDCRNYQNEEPLPS